MSGRFISILLLIFLFSSLYAIDAETIKNKDKYYITSGFIYMDTPANKLSAILTNFDGYADWALRGIDGKDPCSKNFNIIVTDIIYLETLQQFILVFDINLFWPFGSKGNKVHFDIKKEVDSNGNLKTIEYILSDSTPVSPWASLSLEIIDRLSTSKINFTCKIKLAWFIDMFFTLNVYKKNIEMRILAIMRNLKIHLNKGKNKNNDNNKKKKDHLKENKPKGTPFTAQL